MEYTCLKKVHKGFILTRKPEFVGKELVISFSGSPAGATAIFENGKGDYLYRLLVDKTCAVPQDFLVGEIKVTVTILDGSKDTGKYRCEPFCAERKEHLLLVYPNWLDIPTQIVELFGFINDLQCGMDKLSGKTEEIEKKVEKMLAGYDFD